MFIMSFVCQGDQVLRNSLNIDSPSVKWHMSVCNESLMPWFITATSLSTIWMYLDLINYFPINSHFSKFCWVCPMHLEKFLLLVIMKFNALWVQYSIFGWAGHTQGYVQGSLLAGFAMLGIKPKSVTWKISALQLLLSLWLHNAPLKN